MRLGVDLDGVIYPFADEAVACCAKRMGISAADLPAPEQWDFFQTWNLSDEQFWNHIWDGVSEGEVWCSGEPAEGAIESLHTLIGEGHTIHICTHRTGAEEVTVKWLNRMKIPHHSVTITGDKTVLNADLFIDDYEGNYNALWAAGIHCVLMDQPWNRHVRGRRVSDWKEFVEYVRAQEAKR